MSFAQKLLHCNNCKKSFTFTVENQELRSSQGYPNDPVNCPSCRRARRPFSSKLENGNGDSRPNRQMFPVTCTLCRKAVRVPFEPRPGKPIYCIDCQMKTRVGR
jgi:CxxC-x17-CxxC domain-containing protein